MSKSRVIQCSSSDPACDPAPRARKSISLSIYLSSSSSSSSLTRDPWAGTPGSPEDTHMRPPAPARVCAAACVHEDLGGLVIQRTESGGNRRGIARKQRNRRASRYLLPRLTPRVGWTPSGTTGVPVIQRPFQRGRLGSRGGCAEWPAETTYGSVSSAAGARSGRVQSDHAVDRTDRVGITNGRASSRQTTSQSHLTSYVEKLGVKL